MKPGPELDAKIAEILGCNVVKYRGRYACGCEHVWGIFPHADNDAGNAIIAPYSEDIDFAFQAAEQVGLFEAEIEPPEWADVKTKGRLILRKDPKFKTWGIVSCHYDICDEDCGGFVHILYTTGLTPAHAICLAICEYKGVKVE